MECINALLFRLLISYTVQNAESHRRLLWMFLSVISVLGTIGIRHATLNETLTRNQLDYEVARQAAEAALRDAERDLMMVVTTRLPSASCPPK